MNELEKHRINRKLDTKEKVVIKALTEKIKSLKKENNKLWLEVNSLRTHNNLLIIENKNKGVAK
tara:strand:- start:366 stop:557 length:192 start_codon:yes stop_codon:yes gene_type:complete